MSKEDDPIDNSNGLEKNLEAKISGDGFIESPPEVYSFSRHVCQILVQTVTGTSSIGTGFLVSPRHVLTNYHVVESVETDNLQCRFDVRFTDIGPRIGPACAVTAVIAERPYSSAEGDASYDSNSIEHPAPNELDYALLELAISVGNEDVEVVQDSSIPRGWLDLPVSLPLTDISKNVYVLQYPGGGAIKAASGALVPDQPNSGTRLRYLANTESGSSGSPCFQWSEETPRKLLLVAMHNYGHEGRGNKSGFNQGIPVHLICKDLDIVAPGWDLYSDNDADPIEHPVQPRLNDIESAVLSGVGQDVLENYRLEIKSILLEHPSNVDALRLQNTLDKALAADSVRYSPSISPADRPRIQSRGKSVSRSRTIPALALSMFVVSILAAGVLGYLIWKQLSLPDDPPTITNTIPIVPDDTANPSDVNAVDGEDLLLPTSCSVTGIATLHDDYGELAAGEPLSLELEFTYSGKLGIQEAEGGMRVSHVSTGASLQSEISFANFGDNAFNGDRDVIGLSGDYLDGQLGSVAATNTAKPGIDLRGPTTAIDGSPPTTSAGWNRLRQRTLMLPTPDQPGSVTGVARIGQLHVVCDEVTANSNSDSAVVGYDISTIGMLTKKYAKPISAGDNHACAIKEGKVLCWGANNRGQLGDGNDQDTAIPVEVRGIDTAIQISAGAGRFVGSPDAHSCALLKGGQVKCWGAGTEGQLGNALQIDAFEPVSVQVINNAIQISSGGQFTCALTDIGEVFCWGANHSGQLGTGDNEERKLPVKVRGIKGVAQLSTGKQHACVVKVDGTIWCWGANHAGQLGFGEDQSTGIGSSNVPVSVYGINKAVWVGVAESHTCAITADQNVTCWGQNSFGALGDNSEEDAVSPVNTQPRLFASQVDGGNTHTCGIVSDGTVQCWGSNQGKFGNGSLDGSLKPTASVTAINNARWIDAGEAFNCAQTTDEMIYCWGQSNTHGNLGNGSFEDSLMPVRVNIF